jgi:alkylresorcinol/alkylpyrone synthase
MPLMPRLVAAGTALPAHALRQDQAAAAGARVFGRNPDLRPYLELFKTAGIQERRFSFPPDYYLSGKSFDERNADFIEQGTELAAKAAEDALQKSRVKPEQVEALFVVTSTGVAMPGIDALLVPRLGLRRDVRRLPLFGLGCAGGAAALARAAEYLKGHPRHRAMAVAVELCGQLFSTQAMTPADVAGAALFGDGAAAAVVAGDEVQGTVGPRLMGSRSVLLDGPEDLMGGLFTSDGLRPVLSEGYAEFLAGEACRAVEDFVLSWAMQRGKIRHWVLPPGGEDVLEVYREDFGLNDSALEPLRASMAKRGNLASASVLFVLADLLASGRAHPGDKGLMLAVGPGPSAELLLLGW